MNTRLIDGLRVPFTAAEEAAQAAIEAAWVAGAGARAALVEIARLENQVTQRRLREAALGIDGGWLAAQEALIAIERAKVV